MKKKIVIVSSMILCCLAAFIVYKVINFYFHPQTKVVFPSDYQIKLGYNFDMEDGQLLDSVSNVKTKEGLWAVLLFPNKLGAGHHAVLQIVEVKTGDLIREENWDASFSSGRQFSLQSIILKKGKYKSILWIDEKKKATKVFNYK
ncbi:hypothetical protein [Falsibacillus albus]|uniref:Uncharacterized protein n=1 Tax=Falsibacillus albus TaxID=2478915 RepID=A0A3L7K1L1_9BACI|nr:hypothetical protein [Falsibacillus albus]RLQ94562.1 hypothetical protein D9X91_13560 [Falsibacillus albus]